jgi:hypothetical protein
MSYVFFCCCEFYIWGHTDHRVSIYTDTCAIENGSSFCDDPAPFWYPAGNRVSRLAHLWLRTTPYDIDIYVYDICVCILANICAMYDMADGATPASKKTPCMSDSYGTYSLMFSRYNDRPMTGGISNYLREYIL